MSVATGTNPDSLLPDSTAKIIEKDETAALAAHIVKNSSDYHDIIISTTSNRSSITNIPTQQEETSRRPDSFNNTLTVSTIIEDSPCQFAK